MNSRLNWRQVCLGDTRFLPALLLTSSPGGSIALWFENGLCGKQPFKLKENVSK